MSDRVKVWQSDEDGKWRFTYWSSSDRIAWSEGYEDKSYTIKMAEKLYPSVPVEVVEPEGDA